MQNALSTTTWSFFEKIIFRFCFFFFGFNIIPLIDYIVPIIGNIIFNINNLEKTMTGSGDTTYDWVNQFAILLISIFFTIIWTILDKKREHYHKMKIGIDNLVYIYLILNLLQYGAIKIIPNYLQMPAPDEIRLFQRVGDMSPMGMLWTFIGSSKYYEMFCGFSEILAGILLIYRRTFILGVLMAIAVMFYVWILNMCYDVPVKIFSFFLLLCAIYLAAPFFKRLLNFFIFNQQTEPYTFDELDNPKHWYNIIRPILKNLLVVCLIVNIIYAYMIPSKNLEVDSFPIVGNYIIKNNIIKIDTMQVTNISIRNYYDGQKMIIFKNDYEGKQARFDLEYTDSTQKMIIKELHKKENIIATLYYEKDSNQVVMKGIWKEDSISIPLTKLNKRKYLLQERGFHWINEKPFNR